MSKNKAAKVKKAHMKKTLGKRRGARLRRRARIEQSRLRKSDGSKMRIPLPSQAACQTIRLGNKVEDLPQGPLYHYTCPEYFASILSGGVLRGDVPTCSKTGFNAPWLTTVDRLGDSHGWDSGVLDKTSIQLTIDVPPKDRNLWHWPRLAQELQVPRDFYDHLDKAGNGESEYWYVYTARIPAAWIVRALLSRQAIKVVSAGESEEVLGTADVYEWPLSVR